MLVRLFLSGFLLLCMPVVMAYYNNYPKITQMEKQLYSQTYEAQDIYQRLDRIEMSLYKVVQSKRSLADRVDNIASQLHISSMPGYLMSDIEYLENLSLKKNFPDDSPDNRLERLEYHYIGALQEGSYKDRIANLKTMSRQHNINNYFNAQDSSFYDNGGVMSDEGYEQASKWNKVQETLMFFAPIILGIL